MIRTILIAAMAVVLVRNAQAAEPLSIGSLAPKIDAAEFLLGEPVKELARGTVYVVEFAGTQCAPCTRCIPHLTELQKKYKEAVFISVYLGEGKKEVGDFLEKHRDKIGYRVAIDPKGMIDKTWCEAAIRQGVPDAFIVDKKGVIAWIGHPDKLAVPLGKIIAGTFDASADAMRLRLEQSSSRAERRAIEREKKARKESDRINDLIRGGKIVEALAATEAALKEYGDTRAGLSWFRGGKVYLLARLPNMKDASVEFAIEWAVQTKLSRDEFQCRQILGVVSSLLNAGDAPDEKDREPRLVDLGIALLNDAVESFPQLTKGESEQEILARRSTIQYLLGRAHHLKGNHEAAVRHMEETIALMKKRQPNSWESAEAFKKRQAEDHARYEKTLAEYRLLTEPGGKEPR